MIDKKVNGKMGNRDIPDQYPKYVVTLYMKKLFLRWPILIPLFLFQNCTTAQNQPLKIVFLRHGEKADQGDNLNCKGFNRSVLLPAVLYSKFGRPSAIYIPTLNSSESTKHSRMFQTISPFAIKYNLPINSMFAETDIDGIANALLHEKGTVFVVWEHKYIEPILKHLGNNSPHWPDDDFDSIWILTIDKNHISFAKDREGLNPSNLCNF